MREFLLSNGPLIVSVLAVGELLFGILLISLYIRKRKLILLLMAIVSLALCYDASVLACGGFLLEGILKPLSLMRFVLHGVCIPLLLPICAYALRLKGGALKAVWVVTLLIMAGGLVSGLLTKLEPSSAAEITRYLSGEGTPVFAEQFLRILSYGTVVPLIIVGIIVWIKQKTPFLFLSGFLMFAFSALGPATGNFDLIFLIGMFGELFMVLFFLLYGKKDCMRKNGKRKFRSFWLLPVILVILFAGGALYVNDYYHADPSAAAVLSEDIPGITITAEKGRIIFRPDDVNAGLIFYPGGKVEYTAYTPLMKALAEKGFLCVLLEMPLNLAFLNVNAADTVFQDFPEVGNWSLAGHSLGGVAAALYAEKHADCLDGLILLGSYSTANLKENGLKVLSIYGSEDGILNIKEYEKNRTNLPDDLTEVIIPGGCHANFGAYGEQKGDGVPVISREEQILITVREIEDFITEK